MFHILRFPNLYVLGTAALRFSLPNVLSVLGKKQTSVIHVCYLFHIHTAVLVTLCTEIAIPLLAIVSCHISGNRSVVVVVDAAVAVVVVASYCIVILCMEVAIPLLTIVSVVTYQGTALLLLLLLLLLSSSSRPIA